MASTRESGSAGKYHPQASTERHVTVSRYTAPVLRIGTLILVGSPLEYLPYHRNDPSETDSAQKPNPESRHIYTGRWIQFLLQALQVPNITHGDHSVAHLDTRFKRRVEQHLIIVFFDGDDDQV